MKHCPTDMDLKRFLTGRLEDARLDRIGDHLSSCGACLDVLNTISSGDDSVDDAFGQGPTSDWSEKLIEESLGQLMESPPDWLTRLEVDGDDSEKSDAAAPESVGEYDLIEKIGQGGMGAVYRARNRMSKKDVAVKVMSTAQVDSPVARARFESEVQVSAELDSHPNIVATHHAGQDGEWLYLVMERISGIDAGQLIARHGPIPLADACEIAYRTALALQHAHARQLTHRDVKPSNVMIGQSGEVKVLDFGLTRAVRCMGEFPSEPNRELTSHGAILGTPRFMAPEQFHDSRHADIRSDIFSLGMTLYYLLFGCDPFQRTDADIGKTWSDLDRLPPLSLAARHPDLVPELCPILEQMLAIDPGDRFQTPREVAAALKPLTIGHNLRRLAEPFAIGTEVVQHEDTIGLGNPSQNMRKASWLAGLVVMLVCAGWAVGWTPSSVRPSKAPNAETNTGDRTSRTDEGVHPTEPPTLDAWLDGRTVLTVAQDGAAQFQTIAAALAALTPGAVVEILDEGPYFERMDLEAPPEDCGIVSRCGTVIALRHDDWAPAETGRPEDQFRGHEFPEANGIRLSGLTLIGQYQPNAALLTAWKSCGIVVDDCGLYVVDDRTGVNSGTDIAFGQTEFGPTGRPNVISDNITNLNIASYLSSQRSQTLICRNLILTDTWGSMAANIEGKCTGTHEYLVRNNVVVAGDNAGGQWQNWTWQDRDSQHFVMHNNTLVMPGSHLMFNVPTFSRFKELIHGARIQNNIILGLHGIVFEAEAERRLNDIRRDWVITHNGYSITGSKSTILPPDMTDVLLRPEAVETNPAAVSFGRIPLEGPLATSGAADDLPSYIGAVPPGPPPDDGDWLTQACARFAAVRELARRTLPHEERLPP